MTLFTDHLTQIDDLLDKMAESLELGETRWNRMESTYKALYDWLKQDDGYFQKTAFEIYPQGSVRIGAAIKPLKGEEFDLDLVLHLIEYDAMSQPLIIFNRLKKRLSENYKYEGKLEPKNRCIRINFKDDYHMDILPGVQVNSLDNNVILIPDRALDLWLISNPRGYADWFLNRVNMAKDILLEKAYSRLKQENITRKVFMNKPLQRAVQLMKRFRDLYFENKEYATSSIILTTIFGMYYNGEDSIFQTIDNTLERIKIDVLASPYRRIKILNPVNSKEDFTDKWETEPQYYRAFIAFSLHVYEQWQILKKNAGQIQESLILKGLTGSTPYDYAIKNQVSMVSGMREGGRLGVNINTGTIASASSAKSILVNKNTFFGG